MNPEETSTIYLGTFAQGLFKTTDGFETWENIRSGNKLVMGLAINPIAVNEILISEFDISVGSFGIYKSIDAGDSWYKTGEFVANDIVYTNNDTVYFSHEIGIFMSEDNGETVPIVPSYLGGEVVLSLAYEAPFLYAGTEEGELYKIDPSGLAEEITGPWNDDRPTPVHNLIYAGNSIIAGLSGAEQDTLHNLNGGIWQSIDKGASWIDISDGLTNNNIFGNTGLAIDAAGNLLAATYGQGIFQSNDLVLSIEYSVEDASIKLFPNPTDDFLKINCVDVIESIDIIDINGRIVKAYVVNNGQNFLIDIDELKSGLYSVQVNTVNNNYLRKVIIQ